MTTLHLSVLNEGAVYDQLRHIARKVHGGEWTAEKAMDAYRRVVEGVAAGERKRFDEPDLHTGADIDAATAEVAAYHARRIEEEPPCYAWVVSRPDGSTAKFVRETGAFAYILRAQGQSVHHATTHEGWSLEPVG